MTFDPQNPQPGRYDGVPIDVYGQAKGVRRSELAKLIDGTGLDLAYYRNNGVPDTPALRIGSATDDLVFDRDSFDDTYAVAPDFNRRTKAGKEALAEWETEHADKRILSASEYELASTLADAVLCSKAVQRLMDGAAAQPSIWWDQSTVSGYDVLCKTRPDAYIQERGRSFDLKSTKSLKERDLASSMWTFNYPMQVAMFHEGLLSAGLPLEEHVFIWVCKEPPYDVRVDVMTPKHRWFEIGESLFELAVDRFGEIEETQDYSGRSATVTFAPRVPVWVEKETERIDEELNARRRKPRKTA